MFRWIFCPGIAKAQCLPRLLGTGLLGETPPNPQCVTVLACTLRSWGGRQVLESFVEGELALME